MTTYDSTMVRVEKRSIFLGVGKIVFCSVDAGLREKTVLTLFDFLAILASYPLNLLTFFPLFLGLGQPPCYSSLVTFLLHSFSLLPETQMYLLTSIYHHTLAFVIQNDKSHYSDYCVCGPFPLKSILFWSI